MTNQRKQIPTWARRTLQGFVALLIVAVAAVGAMALVQMKQAPKPTPPVVQGPLVQTFTVQQADVPVKVEGHGTVQPRTVVQLVPEVTGRVSTIHDNLAGGGSFKAGEPLIVINDDDYQLAVKRADAILKESEAMATVAKSKIVLEEARLADAESEAKRIRDLHQRSAANDRERDQAELHLQEIQAQVGTAKAQLVSAEATVERSRVEKLQATTNLTRTTISAPFNGRVLKEHVDEGQAVRAGESLGEIYSTAAVEVVVPLDDALLQWFDVPWGNAGQQTLSGEPFKSPSVDIAARFGGRECIWPGKLTRLESHVDAASRMVRSIIQVDSPFDLKGKRPPLLPGSFVDVTIHGSTLHDVIAVPRHAIHNNDEVWVASGDRFQLRKIKEVRADRMFVYVNEGLKAGDRVIVSHLSAVTDGMAIRTASDDETTAPTNNNAATQSPNTIANPTTVGVTPSPG